MMKCILIVTAVTLISCVYGAPGGQDGKKHGNWVMKCDGTELKFTEEMNKGRQTCFAKYHGAWNKTASNEMKTADVKKDHKMHHNNPNITCMMMCQFQADGLIGQDGNADKTKVESFVKAVFPASVQDALVKSYNTCADEKGTSMAVTADGNCDSYKPFVRCIFESNAQACKWGKKEEEAAEE